MYKVFFKDRIIYLHDDIAKVSEMQYDYVGAYGSFQDLKAQLDTFFRSANNKSLFIFHNDLDELYKSFQSYFRFIPAAGGLVRNEKGDNLVIFRRGKWDLPKGKADQGEKPENTAIREVEEECIIKGVTIVRFITLTYHIYYIKEEIVLKRTDWFEMKYTGKQNPKPYEKEDITDFKWLPDDQLSTIEVNTYPSVMEVLGTHLKN
ncbi:MAG: NUDIX domain-containing protein [Bacteroidales bacterium]|nr:NUDIX domain-containing protein [Bacteroidales bacterium]